MKIIAPQPKNTSDATNAVGALHEVWFEYLEARAKYVNARQRESVESRSIEGLVVARQDTAGAWRTYREARDNLKALHQNWKAIFSKMTQERQL